MRSNNRVDSGIVLEMFRSREEYFDFMYESFEVPERMSDYMFEE